MKTYLNKEEREKYCVMALATGEINGILDRWKNNLTTEEHKSIKMAQTYIYKWMDSVNARMSEDFTKQLLRDCNSSEIMVLPTLQAQREFKNRTLEDGFIQISKDTILNLAEHALMGCEHCDKDYKTCDLRQTYQELEIEPFDWEASGRCEYENRLDKK